MNLKWIGNSLEWKLHVLDNNSSVKKEDKISKECIFFLKKLFYNETFKI